MRTLLRHAIALPLVGFLCKLAVEAEDGDAGSGVPKSLLLGSLAPEQAIPAGRIDTRRIIMAIRKE
jgi:hypothetical protein